MAKTKGKNVLLGVLVVFVWGLIAYRILSYFKKVESIDLPQATSLKSAGIKVANDRFKIDASYADPFLKEIKMKTSNNRSIQSFNEYPENYQETLIQVRWPEVSYGGIVESSDKSHKVGLLKIGTSNFLIRQQDSVMGVRVLNIYKDSIHLRYSNSIKTYTTKF